MTAPRRYFASFFFILWTISILYMLDFTSNWVRTRYIDLSSTTRQPTNQTSIDSNRNVDDTCQTSHTKTNDSNIERIVYSPDYLKRYETTVSGLENRIDCGFPESECKNLAKLKLLRHPCPFHEVPKRRRWKKRGKKIKTTRH